MRFNYWAANFYTLKNTLFFSIEYLDYLLWKRYSILVLHYKNGNLEFSQDYCENGNLKSRGFYKNLVPAGFWESFDEESKLIDCAEFH